MQPSIYYWKCAGYCFEGSVLNNFDTTGADRKHIPRSLLVRAIEVKVERLMATLEHYLPGCQRIDFLNVDVEGKGEEVLRSNDWKRYRPRFILAETLRGEILNMAKCPIVQFLQTVGYRPVSKAFNTSFFAREND